MLAVRRSDADMSPALAVGDLIAQRRRRGPRDSRVSGTLSLSKGLLISIHGSHSKCRRSILFLRSWARISFEVRHLIK